MYSGALNAFTDSTGEAINTDNKNTENIYEVAKYYKSKNIDWIAIADENYGEGSKRKAGFPKQPDWFLDARGFHSLETGLKKIGFNENETNGILGNNWYNFYKGIN